MKIFNNGSDRTTKEINSTSGVHLVLGTTSSMINATSAKIKRTLISGSASNTPTVSIKPKGSTIIDPRRKIKK